MTLANKVLFERQRYRRHDVQHSSRWRSYGRGVSRGRYVWRWKTCFLENATFKRKKSGPREVKTFF